MTTRSTHVYICDGCGTEVEQRKDLHKFTISERKMNRELIAEAETDLCTDCERTLHDAIFPLLPESERDYLAGIVRG